jgi:hypothetical protein
MLLREFFIDPTEEELDEGQTWARSGKKVVRKYRCSSGPRKNRIVAKMTQCFAAPDIKKRMAFKKIKARLGARMIRKAKKTKRINPASKRVQALNRKR